MLTSPYACNTEFSHFWWERELGWYLFVYNCRETELCIHYVYFITFFVEMFDFCFITKPDRQFPSGYIYERTGFCSTEPRLYLWRSPRLPPSEASADCQWDLLTFQRSWPLWYPWWCCNGHSICACSQSCAPSAPTRLQGSTPYDWRSGTEWSCWLSYLLLLRKNIYKISTT